MPLLKSVVGGALSGLGEGITRNTEQKRQMDGIRLREKYVMDRMQSQQQFQGEESEINRNFRSTESERDRRSSESNIDAQIASRESEGEANRRQQSAMHDDRTEVSKKRQETINRQVDASIKNLESLDEHRKAAFAQSLKASGLRSEENARRMEASNRPKRMSEKEAREEARKLAGEMDEYGELQPNREKEVALFNVWKRTGQFSDEITLTVDDLKASMRNRGMGFDEVVESLTKRFYVVPPALQRRALRDPDIKSMIRTGATDALTPSATTPVAEPPPAPSLAPRSPDRPSGMVGRMY